jgi:hypothetical protein
METNYYNKKGELVGYLKRGELGTQYVSVKPRADVESIKTSPSRLSDWYSKKSFSGNVDNNIVLL